MTRISNNNIELVKYQAELEEEYLNVHNNGFSREDTPYDNKIETYDEEGKTAKTFLAKYENEFVGLIDLVEVEDRDDIIEIDPIAVLKNYRSEGIGSKLLQQAIEWTRKEGYEKIRALVSASANIKIYKFFKMNNFKKKRQIFASKDGKISEVSLDKSSPFPKDQLKGHVYVYELSFMRP